MDIPDIMTWQIIKWGLIVLVAAFIGQFGKTFAQYVMSRLRRRKAEVGRNQGNGIPGTDTQAEAVGRKGKKKEAKVLLKVKKKADKNS